MAKFIKANGAEFDDAELKQARTLPGGAESTQ